LPGAAYQSSSYIYSSIATVTRSGKTLIANSYRPIQQPNPLTLTLRGRDGRPIWTRTFSQTSTCELINGLLEAPDRGFFVSMQSERDAFLLRLDSLGNTVWRRLINGPPFLEPDLNYAVYTRTGTLLFTANYPIGGARMDCVVEISQNGTVLKVIPITPDPPQLALVGVGGGASPVRRSLLPLRDGGFLIVGQVDSAGTGIFRPFVTRLSSTLQVSWNTLFRSSLVPPFQSSQDFSFTTPFELADGSLLMTVRNHRSGYEGPFWFFRYSATGVLLNRYAFTSPLIPTLHTPPTTTFGPYLYAPDGVQPLSDSTFMLVGNLRIYRNNTQPQITYLAHIKVPGLRRVINSNYIPAANDPLAARPAAATLFPGPAYPNPATETVTVPYRLPPGIGSGRLVLYDLAGRAARAQLVGGTGAGAATVGVGGLAPGVYLLALEVAGQPPATQRLCISP